MSALSSDINTKAKNTMNCLKTHNDNSCYEKFTPIPHREPKGHYTYEQLQLKYPKHYDILIDQPKLCYDNPFIVLGINVQPHQKAERQAIRETYGSFEYKGLKSRPVFFTTVDPDNDENNKFLMKEAELYNDIVQFDLVDHMLNETIYDMLAMNWTSNRCYYSQYFIRAHYHSFIDLKYFIDNYLYSHNIVHKHFIYCCLYKSNVPQRIPESIFYIPDYLFRASKFPPYPSDTLAIYSIDMVESLYETSNKFLPLHYLSNVMIGQFLELQETAINDKCDEINGENVPYPELNKYTVSSKYSPSDLIALWKLYYETN